MVWCGMCIYIVQFTMIYVYRHIKYTFTTGIEPKQNRIEQTRIQRLQLTALFRRALVRSDSYNCVLNTLLKAIPEIIICVEVFDEIFNTHFIFNLHVFS